MPRLRNMMSPQVFLFHLCSSPLPLRFSFISFIHSGDLYSASSTDYYSEALPAQSRTKKKDLERYKTWKGGFPPFAPLSFPCPPPDIRHPLPLLLPIHPLPPLSFLPPRRLPVFPPPLPLCI